MATAQDIINLSNGGGGQQIYDMVRNGQLSEADVRAALGDGAVDSFLQRTQQQAPVPTMLGEPTGGGGVPLFNISPSPSSTDVTFGNVATQGTQTPITNYTPPPVAPAATAPQTTASGTNQTLGRPGLPSSQPTVPVVQPAVPTPQGAPAMGGASGSQGNAGGYLNPTVPGGTTSNNDYSKYPTPIPTSPDYEAAANQQGVANLNAAKGTVALSNPNQFTPTGSQTYSIGPDGRPVQTQTFSADQQKRLDDLNSLLPSITNNIREQTAKPISSYDFQKVLNPEEVSLKPITTDITAGGVNTIADALRAREQPRMDRARQQKEAQLLTRGFNPGTEGWQEAMDDISRSENDFNLGLVSQSGQEQSRLFDLQSRARLQDQGESQAVFDSQMAKRNSQINEQALARTLPIQEYQGLVQAMTPQMPQFNQYTGANVEANPILDATTQQGLFDLGRYGTSVQGELGTRGLNIENNLWNKVVSGVSAVGSFFGS